MYLYCSRDRHEGAIVPIFTGLCRCSSKRPESNALLIYTNQVCELANGSMRIRAQVCKAVIEPKASQTSGLPDFHQEERRSRLAWGMLVQAVVPWSIESGC